ncbi:lysophospholipid acyltransferase family protein [Acidisoma silvae]|uniref:1-acyl-sn-glycerol-3-phosphate acyltransferase n=1 Tax=Acidisoma silvae TaxID=2802396 RepID=A0A963YSA5_9PROT|nr:lysophospholipid acyltransferase family protein [Acidisoma silvae]MCB8875483.1 1-acyl-sn-glycerol-3-phosphate acyltransferase [Acidisoma silvae]
MRRLWLTATSLLFNLGFIATTTVLSLWGYVYLVTGREKRLIRLGRLWALVIIRLLRICCGIRVRIIGLEHLPFDGPALIASVHQSAFDTAIWMLMPKPAYVLKQELLKVPVFGRLMKPSGMIAVDRKAGAKAIRDLMRDGQAARDDGRQVVIFPQGTRAGFGEPRVIQPGIAALAGAMAVPVIPVATNSGAHWGRNAFTKRPGVIDIVIGAPLPAGLARAALVSALDEAWTVLEARIHTPVDKTVGEPVSTFASRTRDFL